MDWEDLRFVLALTREKTLSEAASALGVTRTTVGRRLKDAEKRLGVRLFDRTPEGFVPTAAGDELAQAALRIEGEVLTAEGRLFGRDAELRGRLRVSAADFVFDGFHDVFMSFLQRYPRIELTIQATNERASLVRREADVALRLGNHPGEHLVGRRLGHLQFELYAARVLVERIGPGAALNEYPWLHADERSDGSWLDGWLARNAAGARIALRSDQYWVLRRALSMGIGVHFLPCFIGDADPALVRLGVRLTEEARDLWALTLPDLRHNRRIQALIGHVYDALKDRQAAFEGAEKSALAGSPF